jgi:DNA-binding CsgD family transcriptional regulator
MKPGKVNVPPAAKQDRPTTPAAEPAAICTACGALRAAPLGFLGYEDASRTTFPEAITAALHRIPALTPRERATFDLLGLGYDNRSIARILKISERTAKRHVTAILSKLGLESRLQAGLVALIVAST